uniref:PCI domain-containing protein n=1 Tax=Mucochytrium quahogii TaxID=96639 RepID=A0A7S2WLB9_9STRA|mmetsp:Transcript_11618/g.18905  ORF Transcript_11618/g.18905 Transcript_11618/m.18905 type:complete len:425 (+) Transcript_11618:113-1387(+)|eukprot:CAMPEP_0203765722 /NCGR_PEP_ID=MMETSP0099_2-20121227/22_1 /ASSEMBLY_ACC=CAM_ASM_000209 /TAXON_ID=96639 /ORGANISM=" , Strain NY0313808BC1" /LENGTH=424 /DNA_ID=CAMNT_0050661997 /DNA_START=1104 /DNA_END=2378 /DNA_ORIENTATION=+
MEDSEDVLRERYEGVVALQDVDAKKAIAGFRDILSEDHGGAEGLSRFQEWSLYNLCDLYSRLEDKDSLVQLLKDTRPLFGKLPKAKTAKIVRTVIDSMAKIPNTTDAYMALCNEYIEWCITERRAFLRQRIQTRLANLYLSCGKFQQGLKLLAELQSEVKKLDDKQLLVEIFLIESRVHHALLNLPKAKSSLTAARSVSNSIYVGPLLQAEIDMQGGILNADEKDFRTAYSYFFEAFEGFVPLHDPRAKDCLKYMLLSKIMNSQGDEVPTILNGKNAISFTGPEIESMRAVAKAYKDRSLHEFDSIKEKYKEQIVNDSLVARHLKDLQGNLLEQNLIRIIEPYSRVEIAQVAKLIDLPLPMVETKLSQMILDKKFLGILDQGTGELVVFDEPARDDTYDASLNVVASMSNVVDSLFRRTEHLEA